MDINGFPDLGDILVKLFYTAPDVLPPDTGEEAVPVIAAVIAEFQSPPGLHGIGGGTGREFGSVTETRHFDGNGYPSLVVDDIVPGTSLTVKAFDALYPDVLLKQSEDASRRWNTLVRPQSSGAILGASYGLSGLFPLGLQNINVTTTWGNAVTADIFMAICSEAASRLLIEGFLGLDGAGGKLTVGTFEVDQSGASANWLASSSPAVLHTTYLNCISAHRDRGQRGWKRMAASKRMS